MNINSCREDGNKSIAGKHQTAVNVRDLLCVPFGSKLQNSIAMIFLLILFPLTSLASETEIPKINLDLSDPAIKRGEEVFKTTCQVCHSLKYMGLEASMSAEDAGEAFGKVPPDLSLMAKARGRGDNGAIYIHALLIGYNDTAEKNSVFPNIAMPPVLSKEDKDFDLKARDVAAYLLYASEPGYNERKELGRYVMGYMTVLTILLYLLNRRTWMKVKKR